VAGVDDGGGVHACVDPMSSNCADDDASSSDRISCISLFTKTIVVTSSTDVIKLIATVA
jgi:hypothetical protein